MSKSRLEDSGYASVSLNGNILFLNSLLGIKIIYLFEIVVNAYSF